MNKKEKKLAISTALMGSLPRMTAANDFEGEFSAPKTPNMRALSASARTRRARRTA